MPETTSPAQSPAKTCVWQCNSCPELSLLRLAAELINELGLLLDDLPAAPPPRWCPVPASFNLSNIRPSPSEPGQDAPAQTG